MDGCGRPGWLGAFCAIVIAATPAGLDASWWKHKKKDCCKPVCYVWKLVECEETVFEIEMKTETKKVLRPAIEEVEDKTKFVYCDPTQFRTLRPACQKEFQLDSKIEEEVVRHKYIDECGRCRYDTKVESGVVSCVTEPDTPTDILVTQYIGVPTEGEYVDKYFRPKMVEVEVEVVVPVLKPKKVVRKVWKKFPYCPQPPCCPPPTPPAPTCCEPGFEMAPVEVMEEPGEPIEPETPADEDVAPSFEPEFPSGFEG